MPHGDSCSPKPSERAQSEDRIVIPLGSSYLCTPGRGQQREQRLVELGAAVFGDFRLPDGTGWVTMTDIEGNEFCAFVRAQIGPARIHGVAIDCADPAGLASWWARIFDATVTHSPRGFSTSPCLSRCTVVS